MPTPIVMPMLALDAEVLHLVMQLVAHGRVLGEIPAQVLGLIPRRDKRANNMDFSVLCLVQQGTELLCHGAE